MQAAVGMAGVLRQRWLSAVLTVLLACCTGRAGFYSVEDTAPSPNPPITTDGGDEETPSPPQLTISSVHPSVGSTLGGTLITILGEEFAVDASVMLGAQTCVAVARLSATQLQCTTPPAEPGPVDVVVENAPNSRATLEDGFRYSLPPSPISIAPDGGPVTGGTLVAITGEGFVADTEFSFRSAPCDDQSCEHPCLEMSLTPTGAECITPSVGDATQPLIADLYARNPDDLSGALPAAFTFHPVVRIDGLFPVQGLASGGAELTIDGTQFSSSIEITVGGAACTDLEVLSDTQARCTLPPFTLPQAHGQPVSTAVDVSVEGDGVTATLPDSFVYYSPGALDHTFGTNGLATFAFRSGVNSFIDIKQLNTGHLLLTGTTSSTATTEAWDLLLVRVSQDGILDPSFGAEDGWSAFDFAGNVDFGRRLAVQASGNIAVVGGTHSNNLEDTWQDNMAILHTNSAGAQLARTELNIHGGSDVARAVAIDPTNDKIIVGGTTRQSSVDHFLIARFSATGLELDDNFGTNGMVQTNVAGWDYVRHVLPESDGSIIAVGHALVFTPSIQLYYAATRYTSAGALDTSAYDNGRLLLRLDDRNSRAYGALLPGDGTMVLVGESADSAGNAGWLSLARLDSHDGSFDTSFAEQGWDRWDGLGEGGGLLNRLYAITQEANGALLAAGFITKAGDDEDVVIVRYTPDGIRDLSFADQGALQIDLGTIRDRCHGIVLQDTKAVCAGWRGDCPQDHECLAAPTEAFLLRIWL